MSGFLLTFASRPATSIPSLSVIVLPISDFFLIEPETYPKLTSNAPMTGLRSLQSLGFVAMIGLAPTARVALAESLITTLFVIYRQLPPFTRGNLPDESEESPSSQHPSKPSLPR